MPVAMKKKRSRKASFRANPYPAQEPKVTQLHANNPFAFNPSLKTSSYSNRENIVNGGNPIFQFPIPHIDPHKATLLNDEVDMYFPRKHFLSKYQMLNDLLENIIIKPIPADKITPPRLFPIAFVDGMPYEKKKEELLKDVKKPDILQAKPQEEVKAVATVTENMSPKPNENEVQLKSEEEISKKDKTNCNSETETNKVETTEEKLDPAISKNNLKDDNDDYTAKKHGKVDADKTEPETTNIDEDSNLSDYDPDFDGNEITCPKESAEESKVIFDYLTSRVNMKVRNDFLFGNLETMKMQEKLLAEIEKKVQEDLQKSLDLGERLGFNVQAIDDLHKTFLNYTANSVEEAEKELKIIESRLESKFKQKYVESAEVRQFKTNAFDALKTGITPDEYIERLKKSDLQKDNAHSEGTTSILLQKPLQASEDIITDDSTKEKITPLAPSESDGRLLVEQTDSLDFNTLPHDLTTGESGTLTTASQTQQRELPAALSLAQKDTLVSDQIPGQDSIALVQQNASQINSHRPDVEKDTTDLDEDLNKKQSDMNAFLKAQNNFDFDNEMLYDPGDFNNDDNDDDFGSLSNEVFLNM